MVGKQDEGGTLFTTANKCASAAKISHHYARLLSPSSEARYHSTSRVKAQAMFRGKQLSISQGKESCFHVHQSTRLYGTLVQFDVCARNKEQKRFKPKLKMPEDVS